jgi:hypothetical protein
MVIDLSVFLIIRRSLYAFISISEGSCVSYSYILEMNNNLFPFTLEYVMPTLSRSMIVAYRRRYIVNDLFSSVWAEAVFFKGRKNKGNFS